MGLTARPEGEAMQLLRMENSPSVNYLEVPKSENYLQVGNHLQPNFSRLLKTPEVRSGWSATPRGPSVTPRSQGHSATPVTPYTARQRQDEEELRTRIFWERYAKDMQKELLKDTEDELPKSHLIYSGKCGEEPLFRRHDSTESLATNISLFSTSTLGKKRPEKGVKKRKKKKSDEKAPEIKPDWVMLAKAGRGALDKLIARDAGNMESLGQVTGANIIVQRAQVSELMSSEEKAMLLDCAYRRGISGKQKSYSSANIMSNVPEKERQKLSAKAQANKRMMSPKVIGQAVRNQRRSESSLATFQDVQKMTKKRLSVCMGRKSITVDNDLSPTSQNLTYQSSMRGLPDLSDTSNFTRSVRKRIDKTLQNLQNMTGLGEQTDVQSVISDERYFTGADYAVVPRYPKNIHIAPQLGQVIRNDIRLRMGRPRYHELRLTDVENFNRDRSDIGRSSRNLMIFNWLLSIDEKYEDSTEPSIYDLEGKRPRDRYPMTVHVEDDYNEEETESETEYETETNAASSTLLEDVEHI